ncbi:SRPBCC domain-containing protein [Geotalea uraniireducens]|uniref:Activator of Hsp90 ATPase 1 family protein n=1 Tax=Geotalea uraniireducens (strain Rf4) TaxID=351605 RepID=A5G5K6_GEOUR|nr:SRPBCC domain-containing protein [Geotalea uraniireducens]ABQ27074.1 Activator of Hsp90 ATPase 1 family protein [Geotalea uraniireducens Rf4]
MPKTIQQSITLPAPAARLYDMYLNPEIHAAITGASVTISPAPGSAFLAFNGMIFGTMLYTVPHRLIAQTWRADHWISDDIDSILVMSFWPGGDSGRIELVHVNVADHDVQGVSEGWEKYYWQPWREYLERGGPQGKE